MQVACKDPSTRYGAQNAVQLDAKLGRYIHQIPRDNTSLRLLATYKHLAYQLSCRHQFHQKHQWYENEQKTVNSHTKHQHKPISLFLSFSKTT